MRTAIDALFRAGLRVAWLGLRAYFLLASPTVRAGMVLVRVEGRILLLRNSYRSEPSFPGGLLKWREPPRTGARRELEEEVGLAVHEDELCFVEVFQQEKWRAHIQLHVFALELEGEPALRIDRREVIHAEFLTPGQISEALPELHPLIERFAATPPGAVVGFAAEDPR